MNPSGWPACAVSGATGRAAGVRTNRTGSGAVAQVACAIGFPKWTCPAHAASRDMPGLLVW